MNALHDRQKTPAERANKRLERWRNKLAGDPYSKAAFQPVDPLGANSFLTPRGPQERLGVAYNTVMRAISQLQKQALLRRPAGKTRPSLRAKKLLQIFEEPPQLKPAGKF